MSNSEVHEKYDIEALNSPFSRLYLCPETESIIHCTMGLKNPINIEALKKEFSNSIMIKHPRFCSLMVRNPNGQDQWKKTLVNIDDHFIIHHRPESDDHHLDDGDIEASINAYLSDIAVSSPLSQNKPLWELHVFLGFNCIVLRVHHAIGDGDSLMSMISTCFGQKREGIMNGVNGDCDVKRSNNGKRKWKEGGILGLIVSLWYTIVFGLNLLWRFLWVKDEISVISGGDGVELWPRKMVTIKFMIEELKSIKMAITNVTVNDVLLGIVSSGLSKYIDAKSHKALQRSIQLTSVLMVNLRESPCLQSQDKSCVGLMKVNPRCWFPSWGNKTGIQLLPINCRNGLHSLDHARTMKAIMDKKKHSYEAQIIYWSLKLFISLFGPKVASWCTRRILCNTSLLISNFMGPSKEIAIADNPVSYIRVNCSSQPHAITMHMVSYAGKAELQLMVAKDIINDPEFLAKCFQDSFLDMKSSITRD